MPAGLTGVHGQPSERIGVEPDQRRCEHLRQRQIVDRATHEGEQRAQIVALKRAQQTAAAIGLNRQPGLAQGALVGLESGAGAGKHKNFAKWHGLALSGQLAASSLDRMGNLHTFAMAQRGLVIARRFEPVEGLIDGSDGTGGVGLHPRESPEEALAGLGEGGLMTVVRHDRRQAAVEHLDNRRGIAPGGVSADLDRIEALFEQPRGRHEHPRLGAPEPIDRLTRITHHEDRGAFAGAGIGLQPVGEQPPLQAAGVLKFVEEQMPIAPVEAALHVGGSARIAHQTIGIGFEIGEVDDASGALDLPVDHHQLGAATHHAGVQRKTRPLAQQLPRRQDALGQRHPAGLQCRLVVALTGCRLAGETIAKLDGRLPGPRLR